MTTQICKSCLEVPADNFDTLEELGGTCQNCHDEFNRMTLGDYERAQRREDGWDRGDDDIPDHVPTDEDYQCTECGKEVESIGGSLCNQCTIELAD